MDCAYNRDSFQGGLSFQALHGLVSFFAGRVYSSADLDPVSRLYYRFTDTRPVHPGQISFKEALNLEFRASLSNQQTALMT
jgi:hypothetical protein